MSQQEETKFYISLGDRDPVEVTGRSEAVAHAKKLSADNPTQNVSLERADNMVNMQFREGMLEVFVTETREKPKGRRKDRNAEAEANTEANAEANTEANTEAESKSSTEGVETGLEA